MSARATDIRHYEGSNKLIDELVDRRNDVEELIRGVDGYSPAVIDFT